MTRGQKSRAAIELANSDEFQELVEAEDINMSELVDLVGTSRLSQEDGYVVAWDDYVLVVESEAARRATGHAHQSDEILQELKESLAKQRDTAEEE